MTSISEHRARVIALARPRIEPNVALDRTTGSVLANDTRARLDNPVFANSAMDGFVVRVSDLAGPGPWTLPVVGDIPAGSPAVGCPPGAAVRVMTGAPVPDTVPAGELIVVPVEQTNSSADPAPLPSLVTIHDVDIKRSHIRPAGANLAAGQIVARRGTLLDAPARAALISAGVREVDVYARPSVAVISTGDELVAWPRDPGPAQLPDSNLPMLAGLCRAFGAREVREYRASDHPGSLAQLLDTASDCDVVITSGGISAGAFDVVREVVEPTGNAWFGHVSQRPGGPQGAGTWNGAALVCLPGNPVASFVSFHLYVAPLLHAFAYGNPPAPVAITALAGDGFAPARTHRPLVMPVRVDFSGGVPVATPFTTSDHLSSDVTALTGISGYVILEPSDAANLVQVYPTRPWG